jgi:uncharacterized protein YvpB
MGAGIQVLVHLFDSLQYPCACRCRRSYPTVEPMRAWWSIATLSVTVALLGVQGTQGPAHATPYRLDADPSTSFVPNVPWYHQALALSCEAATLRMALAKEGINTTDQQIMALIPNDPRAAELSAQGMHWGDPYTHFVGDPSGSESALTGYGTYYPTIAAAAGQLGGHVTKAGEGVSPADVYASIQAGHPVIVWVTYQWVSPARQDYIAFDGRSIPYAGPVEHTGTVVGVSPDSVFVNNPLSGQERISKDVFESAFGAYNHMAVFLD